MVFLGFILFQNGKLRSPDLFQYFLDDFGNFENFVKMWARRPLNYYRRPGDPETSKCGLGDPVVESASITTGKDQANFHGKS